jgi:undecaprenyl-diphosphatase
MEFSKTTRRWFMALAGLLTLGFLTLFWGVWHNAPFIKDIDALGYNTVFVGSSAARTQLAEFISLFGNFIVLAIVVLGVAAWLWRHNDRHLAQWFAGTFFLVGGVGTLSVKYLVQRPRPAYHLVNEIGFSFPSGHAMLSSTFFWLLAGLMMVYMMRSGHLTGLKTSLVLLISFALIVAVCWSRVALGVHYLSDVTAGFCLGTTGILVSASFGHLWWNRRGN